MFEMFGALKKIGEIEVPITMNVGEWTAIQAMFANLAQDIALMESVDPGDFTVRSLISAKQKLDTQLREAAARKGQEERERARAIDGAAGGQ